MAMPQMPFHFQINKFYLTLRKHIRLIRIRIRMPFQIHRPCHKYVNHFNFKLKSDEKKIRWIFGVKYGNWILLLLLLFLVSFVIKIIHHSVLWSPFAK